MSTTQQRQPTTTTENAPSMLDRVVETTQKRMLSERAAEQLGCNPRQLMNVLRDNVFRVKKGEQPFSDQELFAAITLIGKYKLDPILRELHVTRDKTGRMLTIVGYDGWLKVLNENEGYDGFDQFWDEDEHGKNVNWCETHIFHKNRSHPTIYRAYMDEWKGNTGFASAPWLIHPRHMLSVRSLCHCARRFASIGSTYTEEEAAMMTQAAGEMAAESEQADAPATGVERAKQLMAERKRTETAETDTVSEQAETDSEQPENDELAELTMAVNDAIAQKEYDQFAAIDASIQRSREEGAITRAEAGDLFKLLREAEEARAE